MNRFLKGGAICVLATSIMGCSQLCHKQPPIYLVAPVPEPPAIPRPQLKIYEITKESSEGQVAMYWRITTQQLINYSKQLEDIVESYRQMSQENKL